MGSVNVSVSVCWKGGVSLALPSPGVPQAGGGFPPERWREERGIGASDQACI